MASLSVGLDTFVICDPERSRSTCTVFLAHVDDPDRERLGRLFVLTEITPTHPNNLDVIRIIQETTSSAYYGVTDRGVETAFEVALAETNSRLQDLLRGEHHQWLSGLSTFIGVQKENLLVFSHVGSVQALLMRGSRIVDLVQASGADPAPNPLKIFSSVVSGQLEDGDTLLVSTLSLLDYFSQEKLRRTVTGTSPSEAAAYLDSLLRDNPANTAFACLILQLHPATATFAPAFAPGPVLRPTGQNQSEVSMERLIERERSTRELLTPSLWNSLKLLTQSGYTRLEDTVRTRFLRKPARRRTGSWREKQPRPRSLFVTGLLALWRLFKRVLAFSLMLLLAGIGSLIRILRRSRTPDQPRTGDRVGQMVRSVRRMTRQQRLILGGVVVLLVSLTLGITVVARRSPTATKAGRAATIASVTDKTGQVKTILTYGDEQGARKLLGEIDALIATLPTKSKNDRDQIASLQKELENAREKTRHAVRPTLTVQADLGGVSRSAAFSLAKIGSRLLAVTAAGTILDVTAEGKPAVLAAPATDIPVVDTASDETGWLLRSATGLTRFTLADKKFVPQTITLPAEPLAMTIFQQRLYIADKKTGQILRFPRSGDGYGTGKSWVTDTTFSTENVRSLSIEGSIYALHANGAITELVQGNVQDFTLDPIDPALTDAASLWTSPDSTYLYVFSPSSERLILFDKSGKLEIQFTATEFKNGRAFAIDEKAKKAYVVTDSTVQAFSLK